MVIRQLKHNNGVLTQVFQPQNMRESNWAAVVERYIKLLQSGPASLSAADVNALYNIAILCPYTAGPAVYQARVLLNAVDMGVWANDEELCENLAFKTEQDNPLKELAKKGWKPEYFLKLYPNPARDYIHLRYIIGDNESLRYEIVNMLGQQVKSIDNLKSYGFEQINTATFSEGVYLIKIFRHTDLMETQRFIIQK